MLQQTPVARVRAGLDGPGWPAGRRRPRWPPTRPARRSGCGAGSATRAGRCGCTRAAQAIVDRHGGEVPADVDDLLALPGVGAYTARAVAALRATGSATRSSTPTYGGWSPGRSRPGGCRRRRRRPGPGRDRGAAAGRPGARGAGSASRSWSWARWSARPGTPRCAPARCATAAPGGGRPAAVRRAARRGRSVRGHRPAGARRCWTCCGTRTAPVPAALDAVWADAAAGRAPGRAGRRRPGRPAADGRFALPRIDRVTAAVPANGGPQPPDQTPSLHAQGPDPPTLRAGPKNAERFLNAALRRPQSAPSHLKIVLDPGCSVSGKRAGPTTSKIFRDLGIVVQRMRSMCRGVRVGIHSWVRRRGYR